MTEVAIVCGKCGIKFAVPKKFDDERRESGSTFWCPNGHPRGYCESEADKLRRERDRLKQDQAWYAQRLEGEREARQHAERQARARKGQITKLRKRAQAGVCPCCNRQFVDLRNHMASKHPGFAAEAVE